MRLRRRSWQCGHRAFADRHGLLHRLAANAQEARGVRKRDRPGTGEGGIFPERVSGNELGSTDTDALLFLQGAHHRARDGHQCRLGILSEREAIGGALPHDVGQLLAKRRVDLVEHGARSRESLRQVLAHADELASLPRECKGYAHIGPKNVQYP
jgi:hypothetical protein